MPRRCIIPTVQIAPQFMPVQRDPHFIMPNVAPVAPSIVRNHCAHSRSNQQKYSCNRPFHIVTLIRTLRILL
jgi:hypothetical protein